MTWFKLEDEYIQELFNNLGIDVKGISDELNKRNIGNTKRTPFAVAYKLYNLRLITLETRDKLLNQLSKEKTNLKNKDFFKVKRIISIRENNKCAICSSIKSLNLAHIIPYVKSNRTIVEESILLCPNCHKRFDKDSKEIVQKVFDKMFSYYPDYPNSYETYEQHCCECNKNHIGIRLKGGQKPSQISIGEKETP